MEINTQSIFVKRACIFSLLVLTLSLSLFGAGKGMERTTQYELPSISLSILSTKPITIGDPVDIALTIYHRKREKVTFPDEADHFLPFILDEFMVKTKKLGKGTRKTMVIYTVTVFMTGNISMKPLVVGIGDASIETESLVVPVLSVLPQNVEDPPLKDIVGPVRAKIKRITVLWIALSIAAAFGCILLVSRYVRKPSGKPVPHQPVRPLFDPFEYSIEQLETLRKEHDKNRTIPKHAYSTISHSIKLFFGSLLSIQALEMTTNELRRYLKKAKSASIRPERIVNILRQSDMVKFAKEMPVGNRVKDDIDESITIIKEAHRAVSEDSLTDDERSVNGV
jgi:hypothetical protein